ncbi:MAG: HD domain-containing protein [Kosmotogaceae bacterium]|nr:HD domain-containing protein [Kosmotogaceae bacterium]
MRFNTKEMCLRLFRLLRRVSRIDLHAFQVACISKMMGRELGLPVNRMNVIGFIHDIGLLNPVQVNQAKRTQGVDNASIRRWLVIDNELQESHSIIGSRIVRHVEDVSDLADVAEKHHYHAILLTPENDHDLTASIIHLADTVSISLLTGERTLEENESIRHRIVNSNEFLEKEKTAFEETSKKKGFWCTVVDKDTLHDEFEQDIRKPP